MRKRFASAGIGYSDPLQTIKHAAFLAAGIAILSACQTTAGDTPPMQQTPSVSSADLPPTESLALEPVPGIPAFSIGPQGASERLAIFITPSCNFCERILLDVLGAVQRGDPRFANMRITFTLMPRKDEDVRMIGGFMCVPDDQRPRAIIDYYRNVNAEIGRKVIDENTAAVQYRRTLFNYGATPEARILCEENELFRTIIANIYNIGDSYRTIDRVPVVLYNENYLEVLDFSSLVEALQVKGT